MALAHLWASGVAWETDLAPVQVCRPGELDVLAHQVTTGFGCVPTSSMGRLFDAVASLVGLRHIADYEAEAAIELEGISSELLLGLPDYRFELRGGTGSEPRLADAARVIRAIVTDVRDGVALGVIGSRFHAAVVALVLEIAREVRTELDLDTVALGGGVFQNALLLSAVRRSLRQDGFTVLVPQRLPPNDGGIALGQLLVATSG